MRMELRVTRKSGREVVINKNDIYVGTGGTECKRSDVKTPVTTPTFFR